MPQRFSDSVTFPCNGHSWRNSTFFVLKKKVMLILTSKIFSYMVYGEDCGFGFYFCTKTKTSNDNMSLLKSGD